MNEEKIFPKTINSLCLYFEINNNKQYSDIQKLIKELRPSIDNLEIILFITDIEKIDNILEDYKVITKKDFTFFGKPRNNLLEYLSSKSCQFLISFSGKLSKKGKKIVSVINAKIKFGMENSNDIQIFNVILKNKTSNINYIEYYEKLNPYFINFVGNI